MAKTNHIQAMSNTFKIATWNVNGLQEGTKKHKVINHLKRISADIVFIQELHYKPGQTEHIKKLWAGEVYEATLNSRSRGVATLIRSRVPFKLISQKADIYGRYLVIKGEIFGDLYTLINVYRPPMSDMTFLKEIQIEIDRSPPGVIILGGDMNSIFSSDDSSNKNRKINPPKELMNFMADNDLQDIWRTLYPNTIDYTYFSQSQNSYSRIDYIFIAQVGLDRVISSKIDDIIISDHAVVSCNLTPEENTLQHRIWRMNRKYLIDKEYHKYINNYIDIFMETNIKAVEMENRAETDEYWDSFKMYIRGMMIAYETKKGKELNEKINKLREQIKILQKEHKIQIRNRQLKELQEIKLNLDKLLIEKANDVRHNSNKLNYIAANKSGKHLASLVKRVTKREPIILKDKTLDLVYMNNQTINDQFKAYYEKLYTTEIENTDPLPFLNALNLKKLSKDQKADLRKEITQSEIEVAIKQFKQKTAPGMDGLPIEFYSTFWPSFKNLFMEVVQFTQKTQKLPATMYEASISVIPKPDRDCETPSDFRPISLINCDKKIITKVINNRLLKILPSIIHHNQTGFIQNRDLKTNTRTCLTILQHAKKYKINLTLMAVDAEKAFDRLERSYLYKVLEVYDFPEEFINMIKTIYKSPKAFVYTNGILSRSFPLNRGTAQGDPLSPSLFALAIEPLAQKIRETDKIRGIEIGKKQYKLSLYADDLLLYLNNANDSIKYVVEVLEEFSKLSGYKINIRKTELLPIDKSINLENCKEFNIQTKNIKYLGCYISTEKDQLYKDNYLPLIKGLKQDVERWSELKINLIGRINLFKMVWLPKFLYVFQTISISPPKDFFKKVNSILGSFIWANKAQRVKRKLLYYPREEGGLNLPNMEYYHMAAQMYYIDHIVNNTNEDPWLEIENHQIQPNNLLSVLFSKNKPKTMNSITNSTVQAWRKIKKIIGHEIGTPTHINIWNNPSINIQKAKINWEVWKKLGIGKLSDFIQNERVIPFQELKKEFAIKDAESFKYLQLKNWITKNLDLKNYRTTEISKILGKKGVVKKRVIGETYSTLIKAESSDELLQQVFNKWNRDLNGVDAGEIWKECLQMTNNITTNENLRLIQYKLMTRIYYSRDKIHKFDSTSSDKCLKCPQSDSLIHAFWHCEKINKVWEKIERWLSRICKCKMLFSPEICIFQKIGNQKYPRGWQILYSSLVYKKLILQNWKNKEAPSFEKWKSLMKFYLSIEESIAKDSNKKKQFSTVWGPILENL